jgi:hypothetical protein
VVEAARAADDAAATVDADRRVVGDVARLLEATDEIEEVEAGAGYGGRVARVGAEIAVALLGRRKQGRGAAQVEDQVEVRALCFEARRCEAQAIPGRRLGRCQAADLDGKTCRGGRSP